MEYRWLVALLVLVVGVQSASGDVFTSAAHLKALLEAEPVAVKLLRTYVQEEHGETEEQEGGGGEEGGDSQMKYRLYKSLNHPDASVSHPVDAFHLVKRWYQLSQLFPDGLNLIKEIHAFEAPTYDDVWGAALALLRLQRTYDVSTEDMAAGKVYGHESVHPLSADDCYTLGEGGMDTKDYGLAAQWFETAVTKAQQNQHEHQEQQQQQQPISFPMSAAYYRLAEAQSLIHDYRASLKAAQLAKEYDPHNSTIEAYLTNMSRSMADSSLVQGPSNMYTWNRASASIDYERLCRGAPVSKVPSVAAPLTCRYKPGRLLPYVLYKEETLSWHPRISMFYDVISDRDIEHVLMLAAPQLKRALVAGNTFSANRIGKLSWLWDFDNSKHKDGQWVKQLSQRVSDITGLDTAYHAQMSSAEAFQVVNYGIGGHYAPHHDYNASNKSSRPEHLEGSGDRITTFMFYLSQVTEGGATVFPDIGVRVPAVKGAAAFWYNANPTLDYNNKTLHAGCPVLVGEKWVANKWIRSQAQMFLKRCPTDPNAIWD